MEYWNTAITQKSWDVLQKIRKEINFVLIGEWAVYLWAKSNKSKGIDIVVDGKELGKLKLNYNLNKNDNLRKYEIKIDEIDIDIYVPFYSRIPIIRDMGSYKSKIEGFNVANPEALLVIKQAAEIDRSSTEKGMKDRLDIMDLLLKCDMDFSEYKKILERENLIHFKRNLIETIAKFKDFSYSGLSPRQFKLKKEELIKNIIKAFT
ncbi:hypothetical protein HYW20_06740 [Candidatus Woesearchaeota archaeon]|nr:hypothetical protein [Candidatus Woesearchaeota archaeon]